jgi:acyl-CoA thioesterase-1
MTGLCVLFFGDDVVAGLGDASSGGIVRRLLATAADAGIDLVAYNLGVAGETSLDVSRRWRKEATPRVIGRTAWQPVFSFGVNDPSRVDAATSAQAMQKIAARTREQGLSPLVIGPPPLGDPRRRAAILELSRRFTETCAGLGVAYHETARTLSSSAAWSRGVERSAGHPGAEAYDELARVVRDAWLAWLSRRST